MVVRLLVVAGGWGALKKLGPALAQTLLLSAPTTAQHLGFFLQAVTQSVRSPSVQPVSVPALRAAESI